MKKTIAIFSLIFVGTLTGIAQPMTDIRIVSEDQHSVVLEFTPHIQAERVSGKQGTIFTRFRFFESQIAYDLTGRTDFIRAVLLLLPSPQYSLQVLASEYQIRDTVKLLPKPTRKALKSFGVSESYDDTSFARTALAPGQNVLAELIHVGQTSIGCVGTLLLHPVQAIDKEKVKIYSRIVVRLNFTNAFPAGLSSSCLLRGELPQKAQLAKMAKVSSRQSVNEDSPLAQGEWYRIEVSDTSTGMYKLDYNYFRSLNISISDINSIRIYGNGGLAIPDDNTSPRPNTLLEIPRLVVDQNNNGIFDPEDYVIFYGRGVRGWHYNGGNTFQHYINPYTEKNYYFFTITQGHGKQMDTLSASAISPSALQPTNFQEKLFVEEEKHNLQNSGRLWVGKLFTDIDNSDTYNNSLPGLVATSPVTYQFKFLHRSATLDYADIFESGQHLGSIAMSSTPMGPYDYSYATEHLFSATQTGGISNSTSSVKIQVTSNNTDADTWLDWMEIYYHRRFEAVNDVLIFTTPDLEGLVQYDISNFSSDIRAFDVTDHSNVKELKYYSADSTVCTIQLQQTGGSVREIAVVGTTGFKIPATTTKIENTINLHNVQSQYDFIIISPTEFLSAANLLKAHRESHDSLRTLVVDINQIYSEFSGGIPDILAIREFLRYTQANWQSPFPKYVLLFGWGYFDYKNISSNQRNWIPPYETEESLDKTNSSYATDDEFILLDSLKSVYSAAIGRLPARSVQEASVLVNKIISYETTAPVDQWRNSFTFVADDGITSDPNDPDDGTMFTDPTEALAESNAAKSYEKKKIYIVEYPTVNSALGRRKPNANTAIVDAINQGTLYTNFIGHGNDKQWTHEDIFDRDSDLPKLSNQNNLTFVVAASCEFSLYDDPSILSTGEQLVTMEQGGAIGTFGAARKVYNTPNVALNTSFFSYLLTKDSTGRNPRLGDAVQLAKSDNSDAMNTQKFHLFGDPTLRLLIPKNVASVDSVNGRSTSSMVAIKSLGHVPIQGAMRLKNGTPITSFQGKGTLQVFDSQREVHIVEGIGDFRFKENGGLLFRGGVSINNGQFEMTIPIPKDVTFGNQSRISMYAWNDETDGAGYTENVMINGIDSTAAIDTVGPQISIYLNDLNFRTGDVVKSNPVLIVRLHDESGINTSTAGVGHQLSATISNPERTFDLSNYYQSDIDTYKSGEVSHLLGDLIGGDLSEGKYTLSIKAWDVQNNSSEAETNFEVSIADDLTMLNVVNYPNPFSNSTTFTFQRNGIDPIDVEIRIFSIAGRLIGKMAVQNITDRSVRIPWDGRDNDGDRLANGVYLYKLIARSQNGQHTNETIGKLAVVR
ncbi:MAG: type IX secretion system sortase PorU [Bacteroidota bacterium]